MTARAREGILICCKLQHARATQPARPVQFLARTATDASGQDGTGEASKGLNARIIRTPGNTVIFRTVQARDMRHGRNSFARQRKHLLASFHEYPSLLVSRLAAGPVMGGGSWGPPEMTAEEKPEGALVTREELALALGISTRTIRRLEAAGLGFPVTPVGPRTYRYDVAEVKAWLRANGKGVKRAAARRALREVEEDEEVTKVDGPRK
jgi:hypothetical protein